MSSETLRTTILEPRRSDHLLTACRSPYVAGRFVESDSALDVANPASEAVIATVGTTDLATLETAITAARSAFDDGPWPRLSVADRAKVLHRWLDELTAQRAQLIETAIAETGCPRWLSEMAQVDLALSQARDIIELAGRLPVWLHNPLPLAQIVSADRVRTSIRSYEPTGVVAAISPYNYPLLTNLLKCISAMAVGCSVILRPSPLTPLTALAMGAAADATDLPPGVFNAVVESGSELGAALSTHPGVDLVSFTGSTEVGRRIAAQAAPTVKRLLLELGGKSVQLYLPDALAGGVGAAAAGAVGMMSSHSGQACVAQSRMLVPVESLPEVLEGVAAAVSALAVGDPSDPQVRLGPLISAAQRERCERIVAKSIAEGAKLVTGGDRPPPTKGWFVEPTVLEIDSNRNVAAQTEIFGPVLTVQGYSGLDEAVAIANDTEFGLSGGVYTHDLVAGLDVAKRIRSGTVQVNGASSNAWTPAGGMKQSGLGRERGEEGLRAYQEVKHIVVTTL